MDILRDTLALMPLLVVLFTAMAVLLLDVLSAQPDDEVGGRRWLSGLSVVGLSVAFMLAWRQWDAAASPTELFGGSMLLDRFGLFFDGIILLSAGLACLLSPRYLEAKGLARGEHYALILFSVVGMMVMTASGDLIVVFIGLETMSVCLYALAGYIRGDAKSAEAGLKYFLLGAFASSLLVYGIALLWGATGSTRLAGVAAALAGSTALLADPLIFISMALLLVGLAFKVALVPFHMWTPDVYEGAPTPVTAFMASAVKAAGFAILLRVLVQGFFERSLALSPGGNEAPVGWFQISVWLAILTMVVGNVLAVQQSNVKRMLAYSSIAHAGYIMVAVAALVPLTGGQPAAPGATAAVMVYLLAYSVATVGAFGALSLIRRDGDDVTEVRDLHGFAEDHPVLALAFTLFLLSLAGLPPTAGFIAKLGVFREALAAGDVFLSRAYTLESGQHVMHWLVIIAALNSVVAVVYYLRPVVAMWMKRRRQDWEVIGGPAATTALIVCAVLTLWLGILPGDVVDLARAALAGFTGAP